MSPFSAICDSDDATDGSERVSGHINTLGLSVRDDATDGSERVSGHINTLGLSVQVLVSTTGGDCISPDLPRSEIARDTSADLSDTKVQTDKPSVLM